MPRPRRCPAPGIAAQPRHHPHPPGRPLNLRSPRELPRRSRQRHHPRDRPRSLNDPATVRGGLYGSPSSWRMAPAAGAAWRTAGMTNALKRLCGSRELKLGHFLIEFATPGIGHILKGAGCDFAFIDMEHSGFSFETVKSAVRYCEAAQLPAIVRVPSKSYHHIARAADIGAEAVMVPMVDTDAEARELVSHLKYTPLGARGVALGIAHDNFRGAGPVDERLAAANERTCLFALIETASGVEHVDAIAAVEGVDGLWIGHFDLSSSLGVPGEFT